MSEDDLGGFIRAYLDRAVNARDASAVDDLVSSDYRGSGPGWPADRDALRTFYARQAVTHPDWHIAVQQTIQVGEYVAVHANAGGNGPDGRRDVEWLAVYRVVESRIAEIELVTVRERGS